jgi:Holliday junction DNA helicase RuvB
MTRDAYKFDMPIGNDRITYYVTGEEMLLSEIKPVKLKGGVFLYKQRMFTEDPTKNKKDDVLDLEGLPFTEGVDTVNLNRPQTFEDYVGQEHIKTMVRNAIEITKIKNTSMAHTLIYGARGLGKTTLAYIIANYLKKEVVEVVGGMLTDKQTLINVLKKITPERNILFIDEIHSIPSEVGEILYPILEDGKIEGKRLIHFTLIGATTEIGSMSKNYAPLIDRFPIQLNLMPYTCKELAIVVEKLAGRYNFALADGVALKIGSIARGTARLAVNFTIQSSETALLDGNKEITLGIIDEVMRLKRIKDDGITEQDIQVLIALSKVKALGVNAIAQLIRVPETTYQNWIEPYLAERGFVVRLPRGRTISDEGRKYLQTIGK